MPTPGATSPGWKGEDHSSFSCGCQSLDTHRAQCSQRWIMPRKSPLCQTSCTQEGPQKCSESLHAVQRATIHPTSLSNPQITPWESICERIKREQARDEWSCWLLEQGASLHTTDLCDGAMTSRAQAELPRVEQNSSSFSCWLAPPGSG